MWAADAQAEDVGCELQRAVALATATAGAQFGQGAAGALDAGAAARSA